MEELKLYAATWGRRRRVAADEATDEDEVERASVAIFLVPFRRRCADRTTSRPRHRGGDPVCQRSGI
eukprot:8571200-Lingulodinium_polyedra.AAC.1